MSLIVKATKIFLEILSLGIQIGAQFTKRGEKMIKQSCMFTRGLSDDILGWSEHREMLREIAELFNFFFCLFEH